MNRLLRTFVYEWISKNHEDDFIDDFLVQLADIDTFDTKYYSHFARLKRIIRKKSKPRVIY